jgi:hypothetical protein
MRIVVEPAGIGERGIERVLAGVAERRMTEVVSQAQCLGQILVEPERPGHGTANLRDFQAVRKAYAVMITVRRNEDLRLVPKSAESDRMDDAVAVALINVAGSPRSGAGFGMEPAARC